MEEAKILLVIRQHIRRKQYELKFQLGSLESEQKVATSVEQIRYRFI